jgi:hypothetical protein
LTVTLTLTLTLTLTQTLTLTLTLTLTRTLLTLIEGIKDVNFEFENEEGDDDDVNDDGYGDGNVSLAEEEDEGDEEDDKDEDEDNDGNKGKEEGGKKMDEAEDDSINVSTFVAIIGCRFTASPDVTSQGLTFIMTTTNEDGIEQDMSYMSSEIKVGFVFIDGVVQYPNNKIPELDRNSLGWDHNLIGETICGLWRNTKTSYIGLVRSYNLISETHSILWDDGEEMEINLMERSHRRVAEWKRSKCPYVPSQAVSVVYNNGNLLHKRKRPEPNTVSSVTRSLLVTIDAKVDKSSLKDGDEMDTAKSETDDEEALRDKTTFAVLIQEGKLGTLQEAKTFKQVCTMRGLGYKYACSQVALLSVCLPLSTKIAYSMFILTFLCQPDYANGGERRRRRKRRRGTQRRRRECKFAPCTGSLPLPR